MVHAEAQAEADEWLTVRGRVRTHERLQPMRVALLLACALTANGPEFVVPPGWVVDRVAPGTSELPTYVYMQTTLRVNDLLAVPRECGEPRNVWVIGIGAEDE